VQRFNVAPTGVGHPDREVLEMVGCRVQRPWFLLAAEHEFARLLPTLQQPDLRHAIDYLPFIGEVRRTAIDEYFDSA
jgi:hypothetical protein